MPVCLRKRNPIVAKRSGNFSLLDKPVVAILELNETVPTFTEVCCRRVDTSVVAHALLGASADAVGWPKTVSADPDVSLVSSRLIRTELTRVLRREGLPVELRDVIMDHRLDLVPLRSSRVLRRLRGERAEQQSSRSK